MAARTDSRFLVIPCCYFQLDGSRHKGLSGLNGGKYREYTEYIKDIGVKCGYCIDEDQLRIPSTRNIAVVGQRRNPEAVVDPVIASVGHFVARVSDRELEQERRKRAAEKGK
ncbi:tRNA methyltransferase 44 [Umbelopsis nana]